MKTQKEGRTDATTYRSTIGVGTKVIIFIFMIAGAAVLAKISLLLLLMFFLSLLPSFLVAIADIQRDRNLLKVAICFNLFGMMPYLGYIISSSDIDNSVPIVISQPSTWMVIYISCTIGVVLYLLLPKVTIAISKMRLIMKMKSTRAELNSLHKEWAKSCRGIKNN